MRFRSICLYLLAFLAFSGLSSGCGKDSGPGVALELDAGDMDVEPAVDVADEVAPEDVVDSGVPDFTEQDFCGEVLDFRPIFTGPVETWKRQDDVSSGPERPLLITGSSSVRRWEDFARLYSGFSPLQRGFGGGQLGEVALFAEDLVVRHDPRAVVVFAGTNDVVFGVSPEVVVTRFRCLRQRIGQGLGWDRPVFFIGITPTPSRWSSWETSNAINEGVQALEAIDPALHYVDIPTAFLETGQPPSDALFVGDKLHLSPEGYSLWESVLRPEIERVVSPNPPVSSAPTPVLASGTRILVDFGPNNEGDGEDTPSPDYLGQHWNNWHGLSGDLRALPGEHLDGLRTSTGEPTSVGVVVSGGFAANGWANGGFRWPEQDKLGTLAVGSATGDFFYMDGEDITGGLYLRGLDPQRRYTLRLFGSRQDDETRVTRYTVSGAESVSDTLQTSGAGAGGVAEPLNDDDIATFVGVRPDAWGHVFVDVGIEQGTYAYLSLLELTAE